MTVPVYRSNGYHAESENCRLWDAVSTGLVTENGCEVLKVSISDILDRKKSVVLVQSSHQAFDVSLQESAPLV